MLIISQIRVTHINLLFRWQLLQGKDSENFPTFDSNRWFDTKVCKGFHKTKKIHYVTQYRMITKAFNACNIHSKHKTHAGRGSGARQAEAAGVSEDNLKRHGRWETGSMGTHYLKNFPFRAIRSLSGFPIDGGQFFLERAVVTPSESLQQKVFPSVEHWLSRVQDDDDNDCPQTICAQGFLNLIKELRVVFLQDVVMLRDLPHLSTSKLFNHALFEDPEFLQFEQQLLTASRTESNPQQTHLHQVAPIIANGLSDLGGRIDGIESRLEQHFHEAQQARVAACNTAQSK